MDKIRNIEKYIETVKANSSFFQNYYFNSIIDLNLDKLDYILQYGILSKHLINQKGLIELYTHPSNDFDSKNGNNYVSLSEYTENSIFNPMFESFSYHTLTSISLLVDKSINVSKYGERETYFDDELFCHNLISPTNLEGIILPEHLTNLNINEINCLPNVLSCYTKRYLNNWIHCMEVYFKHKLSEKDIQNITDSYEQLWSILEEYESPEKWIQSAIRTQRNQYGMDLKDVLANILQNLWSEKLELQNPYFIDVLIRINKNSLPIYEIKSKCLKRIH